MNNVVIHNHQTPLDLAIQNYGSVEGIVDLLLINNLSVTDTLEAGQQLQNSTELFNQDIVTYYDNRAIRPATGENLEFDISLLFEAGIFTESIFE